MEDAAPNEKIQGTGDNRLCSTTENRSTSWIPHHNLNNTDNWYSVNAPQQWHENKSPECNFWR